MRSFGLLMSAGVLGAVVVLSPADALAQAPGAAPGAAPNAPPPPPAAAGRPAGVPSTSNPVPTTPSTTQGQPATGTGPALAPTGPVAPRGAPGAQPPRPAGAGAPGATPGATTPGAAPTGAAATTGVGAIPDVARASSTSDMTASSPNGLTAEQVGARAAQTSFQAKAAEQTAASASARAEQQWTNYIPRIGFTARYTRLSDFTPPTFGSSGGSSQQGSLVGTPQPGGTINPTPTVALDSASLFSGFTIPLVLDQYLTQVTLAVPISDYFLRIGKAYSAATQSEEAARYDVIAARAKSYSDGKVAYFTWLRARGAVGVAEQSLAVARAHLKDAENQFAVGNASKADVLRAQTQVAGAELAVERAKSAVAITERSVRVALHAPEEEKLVPAETLDGDMPPPQGQLKELVAEAHRERAEVKSIDKNVESTRKLVDVQKAGRYPVLSAFGDVTYANPNQRRFPQRNEWFATWAVGAQITWSPNDVFAGNASSTEVEARAASLEAQKAAVRDGVEIEVTQAYQAALEADTAVTTTARQLESALEGYRVARELFNNGRGTATTLIDAEIVLAQTRFEHLNARVDARLARVRLEHALGRDTKVATSPPPAR